jgi:hypothetical protein
MTSAQYVKGDEMKLWLDDDPLRDPPADWTIVRTAEDAIELLATHKVSVVSLDHDLGVFVQDPRPREITGMAVIEWMNGHHIYPDIINIHSFNEPAARRMLKTLAVAALRMRYDNQVAGKLSALWAEKQQEGKK